MILRLSISLLLLLCSIATTVNAQHKVAIIIDDIGYRHTDNIALSLPGNITYSVLPHTPFGKSLAEEASLLKREIMLHIPMEALNGKFMGPGGLSANMTEHELKQTLYLSLADIPQAVGVNNHMGSKLTTLNQPMTWVMQVLKEQNLFFIDSKTNQDSLAEKTALNYGVPTLHRHIFLDNQLTPSYIKKQFQQLINVALANKSAIGIAHPHPETITMMQQLLPELAKHNIELVSVSTLFNSDKKSASDAKVTE